MNYIKRVIVDFELIYFRLLKEVGIIHLIIGPINGLRLYCRVTSNTDPKTGIGTNGLRLNYFKKYTVTGKGGKNAASIYNIAWWLS